MRKAIPIAILCFIVLALLNPGMNDFRLFVQRQSEVVIRQEAGEGPLVDLLAGAGSRLASDHIHRITDRRNYVIFSTYTIDLDGREAEKDEWRFIGIAGQFVETHRPESLMQ